MNAAEVIDGAIDYINKNGWCQNRLITGEGQVCLRGALFQGAGWDLLNEEDKYLSRSYDANAYQAAANAVEDVLFEEGLHAHIPTFNDEQAASQEDVILILKKAREVV